MSTVQKPIGLLEEIADLIVSRPTREQLLNFRPSEVVQERARELLAKSRNDQLSEEEEQELLQFEQAEMLMRLIKARVRLEAKT